MMLILRLRLVSVRAISFWPRNATDGHRAARAVHARADAVGSICTLCSLHIVQVLGVLNGDVTARGGISMVSAAAAADAGSTSTARGLNRAAADGDISTRATIIGADAAADAGTTSIGRG